MAWRWKPQGLTKGLKMLETEGAAEEEQIGGSPDEVSVWFIECATATTVFEGHCADRIIRGITSATLFTAHQLIWDSQKVHYPMFLSLSFAFPSCSLLLVRDGCCVYLDSRGLLMTGLHEWGNRSVDAGKSLFFLNWQRWLRGYLFYSNFRLICITTTNFEWGGCFEILQQVRELFREKNNAGLKKKKFPTRNSSFRSW